MNVLIVTFELAGLEPEHYRQLAEQVAPQIAEVPGLLQKAWLADDERQVFGGTYLFTDRASIDAYLGSEFGQAIRNPELFRNVEIRGLRHGRASDIDHACPRVPSRLAPRAPRRLAWWRGAAHSGGMNR